MKCPNCSEDLTLAHLRTSEECAKTLQSMCGLYRLSKRKTVSRAGGRPKKQKPEGSAA
jgi:hypothetical protein